MPFQWTSQQQQALDKIGAWWKDNSWGVVEDRRAMQQGNVDCFTLDGYAGTGKTTLAKELPTLLNCSITYAAFTGKAASVLRRKGMDGATTLHSILFKPKEREEERHKLEAELEAAPEAHKARIAEQLMEIGDQVSFMSDPDEEPPPDGDLLVVDERSMIDEWMIERIGRRFRRVLFLGDPFQLKPVKGVEAALYANFVMTDVQRHAGPLLQAVTRIRNGDDPWDCVNEDFSWGAQNRLWDNDVILCHRNATRKETNERQRHRQGHEGRPRNGEPMVILKNAHGYDMWNGEVWKLGADAEILDKYTMGVSFEDRPGRLYEADMTRFRPSLMRPRKIMEEERDERRGFSLRGVLQMDYGYGLTVHKSQGSEWPNVGIIHDYAGARNVDWRRWLYTACTRAQKRVQVHSP